MEYNKFSGLEEEEEEEEKDVDEWEKRKHDVSGGRRETDQVLFTIQLKTTSFFIEQEQD